ncbi:hypothetical protein SAMN06272737_10895 [Blastococcus mobilis]|uniref:Uncharacterized protein n=1 Tax=Blastococcus mobilis TaxID=1938746 RepID=A0A238WKE6_9ACTN|nr:hypothetical protein SAMN06272737_10895 [Blastococcus mobilis]
MQPEEAAEVAEPEEPHKAGVGRLGDVEDDQTYAPVGQVGEVTVDVGGAVQVGERGLIGANLVWPGPARDLPRLGRIGDVEDYQALADLIRARRR